MANSKTDVWMPLYIGDYLAATTHLSAEESGAYLHLLMHQWKNGSLPSDTEALRRIARVEKDAWSNAWALLESFFDHATGVPVQLNLERIREDADTRKAASVAKAKAAAEKRWGNDAPSIPPSNASSNAQAMPQTCPSSSPSPSHIKQVQKPSRDKRESDPRHVPFKLAIQTYQTHKGATFTWDASEAKALDLLLKAAPTLNLLTFQQCLNHRARSPGVPHGERPRVWLPHILKYEESSLNEFGKTGGTNGNHSKTGGNLDAAKSAFAILDAREANRAEANGMLLETGGGD